MVGINILHEMSGNRKYIDCCKDGIIFASKLAHEFNLCIDDIGIVIRERVSVTNTQYTVVLPNSSGGIKLPWKVWLRKGSTVLTVIGEESEISHAAHASDGQPHECAEHLEAAACSRPKGTARPEYRTPHDRSGVELVGGGECPAWFHAMARRHVDEGLLLAGEALWYLRDGVVPLRFDDNKRARYNWKRRMQRWRLHGNEVRVMVGIYRGLQHW
jgi:hypothetical protein